MPSTFSLLGLELMATGEKNNAWGGITNLNLQMLEQTAAGVAEVTMGDGNYQLAISQGNTSPGRSAVLRVISSTSLTAARNFTMVDNTPRLQVIHNLTTGGQDIVVRTTAGGALTIPNGRRALIYATSSNIVEITGSETDPFNIYVGVADTSTDNTALLQAALSVAALTSTVLFVPTGTYRLDAPVTLPVSLGGLDMAPGASFLIGHDGVALDTQAGTTAKEFKKHTIDVVKLVQSDWLSEGSIGFRATNFISSNLNVRRAQGFTIGLQLMGDGASAGSAFNEITLGRLYNNKIGVDFKTSAANSYVNENTLYGGAISPYGVNVSLERMGIRFTQGTGGGTGHYNNVFIKPTFNLSSLVTTSAFIVRDEVAAVDNLLWQPHLENANKTLVWTSGGGYGNVIQGGHNLIGVSVEVTSPAAQSNSLGWQVEDKSFSQVRDAQREVHVINNFARRTIAWTSGVGVLGLRTATLANVSIGTSIGAHSTAFETGITQTPRGVILGASRALAAYVNTEEVKNFQLAWTGAAGRPVVWSYDQDDNIIDTSATPVRLSRGALTYGASSRYWWGTSDTSDANANRRIEIFLPTEAKRALIGVARGSVDASVESFSLTTKNAITPVVIPDASKGYDGGVLVQEFLTSVSVSAFAFPVPKGWFKMELEALTIVTGYSNLGIDFSIDGGTSFTAPTTNIVEYFGVVGGSGVFGQAVNGSTMLIGWISQDSNQIASYEFHNVPFLHFKGDAYGVTPTLNAGTATFAGQVSLDSAASHIRLVPSSGIIPPGQLVRIIKVL